MRQRQRQKNRGGDFDSWKKNRGEQRRGREEERKKKNQEGRNRKETREWKE
jgi:hypothetical protein